MYKNYEETRNLRGLLYFKHTTIKPCCLAFPVVQMICVRKSTYFYALCNILGVSDLNNTQLKLEFLLLNVPKFVYVAISLL